MKKFVVTIRNSGFARWARSLRKHFKKGIKIRYKTYFDPDEITGKDKEKEWLKETKNK